MSRTDKDLHWRLREWPAWIGSWGIHVALSHPGKHERHTEWWGPDRARSRDECRELTKEYNAHGDVDTVPTARQHRHGVQWWS